MIPATIDEYAQLEDAEWTLLVHIKRRDAAHTEYFLSSAPYETTDDDQPYMLTFWPIISPDSLPEFKRSLDDPFEGTAATSFGTLTLLDSEAAFTTQGGDYAINPLGDRWAINPAGNLWAWALSVSGYGQMKLTRGAEVTVMLAAPRRYYAYSTAKVLMRGIVNKVGGNTNNRPRVEIVDLSSAYRKANVPVGNVPLCFGLCRNVEPKLVTPSTLEYAVHDGQIKGVLNVYDDGVLLTPVSQWTQTPLTGRFKLVNQPVGLVTCDSEGAVVNGVWLQSTKQIVDELMRRAGQDPARAWGALQNDTVGLYLTGTTLLGDLTSSLIRACAAQWNIDKLGIFRANPLPIPGGIGPIVDESIVLNPGVTWDEERRLYQTLRYRYRRNWTKFQSKPAASAVMADFSQSDGLEGSVSLDVPDSELIYQDPDLVETYFDEPAPAIATTNRLLKIYGVPRKRVSVPMPFVQEREVGDDILISDGNQNYRGSIITITDQRSGGYPKQPIVALV